MTVGRFWTWILHLDRRPVGSSVWTLNEFSSPGWQAEPVTNHLKKQHVMSFPGFRGKKKIENTAVHRWDGEIGLVTVCVGKGEVVTSNEWTHHGLGETSCCGPMVVRQVSCSLTSTGRTTLRKWSQRSRTEMVIEHLAGGNSKKERRLTSFCCLKY